MNDQAQAIAATPSFAEATRVFAKIGLLSFGGPAAQIALMHRLIVDEKKWLNEREYLSALGFCNLLPGPEAMQLATYAGWKLHGTKGGLMAGLLFVIPGAIVVLGLTLLYALYGQIPLIEAVFFGVKAAVLVIVIEALLRVAKRALKLNEHWIIAGLTFAAIFFLGAPFPLIVAAAALFGFLRGRGTAGPAVLSTISHAATVRTILIWLVIWAVPLLAIVVVFGTNHVLSQLSWFFSKLAMVTFGGAYAVLAYMGQDVVEHHKWLTAGQMLDGLGLAETTPGPLILVTEFVGFLAAYQASGKALGIGLLGAFVALWATFAPCFLWIFAGAPYVSWINEQPRLKSALAAITAAVVGVILNLAIWFALHVIFAKVTLVEAGPLKLWTPTWSTLDWRVVALATISTVLLLVRHWGIPAVLGVASILAIGMHLTGLR